MKRMQGSGRPKPALALIAPSDTPAPPSAFDATFYLATYPDVAAFQGDPIDHYLRHGRTEFRYPDRASLEADIRAVEASGQFDREVYDALYGRHDDPVRHFLVNYRYGPLRPNAVFDGAFVSAYYRRSLTPGENPFLFYCRHRHRPWCYASAAEADFAVQALARSPLFDAAHVRATHLAGRDGLSPEHYYLTEGFRLLGDPSPQFSTAAYLYDSPDIVLAQVNPLLHYETGGRAELRPVAGRAGVKMLAGGMKPDPERRTLLLVSHQASRTGAPILALNLMRRLSARFNVVSLLLEGGALLEDFQRLSCAAVVSGMRVGEIEAAVQEIMCGTAIDCALLNTVVSVHAIEPLVRRGVPILTLIHDFAQYTRPMGLASRAVALSDRVLYPAEVVREAALVELTALLGVQAAPANTGVRAQGRCLVPSGAARSRQPDVARAIGLPPQGPRPLVVLGAGHVELRKGVDLFIETARAVRDDLGVDCRFVWIGGGYDPVLDAGVSAHLEDQVRKSGLEGCVVFVEAQDSLDPWMEAADAFFMSSRLDPYPNVALDALAQGLPVVCFDKATGVAELAADFPGQIRAAPYLRTAEAAELLVAMGRGKRRAPDKRLRQRLDFDPYAEHVASLLHEIVDEAPRRRAEGAALIEDGGIDLAHFAASLPSWLLSPLGRLGPTAEQLARLANRLGATGLPMASLRPGMLVADDGTYPSLDGEAGSAAGPGVIVVRAEDPADIGSVADQLFRGTAEPKVLVVSHALAAADLAPLKAILPRGGAKLLTADGDTARLAAELTGAIPAGALVQLQRFPPGTRRTAQDPELAARACAALTAQPGLKLVLAPALPHPLDPPQLMDDAGAFPGHMADQRLCWLRADEAAFTAAMLEQLMTPQADQTRLRPWQAPAGGWAIVETGGDDEHRFDLAWGREEFDPRA